MEQPQVLNTLATKRAEIQAYIASLERDLEQARRDLSAVLATEKVFSGEGAGSSCLHEPVKGVPAQRNPQADLACHRSRYRRGFNP